MADHLLDDPDSKDGVETPEDPLSGDLNDLEDDTSLLDAGLTDLDGNGDHDDLLAPTPTDDSEHLLDNAADDDPEIEAIKARVKEMEEEAEKLKEMQGEVDKQLMSTKTASFPTPEEKAEADARSVHIGNVDYQSTAEELGQHFQSCGPINRVTILCDKFTGHPKGFAYVEFVEKSSISKAVELDESLFKGRQIKVAAKRTNKPGLTTTNRGRGRGGRGRGFRGGGYGYGGGYMMMPVPAMPMYRGRGRGGFRGGRAKSNCCPVNNLLDNFWPFLSFCVYAFEQFILKETFCQLQTDVKS
ncbi:polyadenylate-binding protein 2-like isoform X2 [Halichondria panicea]|uniref:polyadenylate-binding protein 2-like isoform X2 n=1 Tax=Halichondria panicea TaxID=6063 RepID=UPI00312B783C